MRYFGLLCLFLLAACAPNVSVTIVGENVMPDFRYLALGDSYTIGESVSEDERWPNQLAELLKTDNNSIEVTVIARTGWTTDELWDGIQSAKIQPPYDLVSLLIGVNNQYRGRDIEEYREGFVFLLNKAIEYAGGDLNRVFVLSIPDWGVTPFASSRDSKKIATEINWFNSINEEESKRVGVHYVDVTQTSREAVHDASWIASDGLHPSGKMYTAWAKLAYPEALKVLNVSK